MVNSKQLLWCAMWATGLTLTACGTSEPTTLSKTGKKLPDLASVPTIEICEETASDLGVDAVVASAPMCQGCGIDTPASAADGSYDTSTLITAAPGAEQGEFSIRVDMPVVSEGPRSVGITLTKLQTASGVGPIVSGFRISTYLKGVLQDQLVNSYQVVVGQTPKYLFGPQVMHVEKAFDSLDYAFVPERLVEPVTMRVHEFCTRVRTGLEWEQ